MENIIPTIMLLLIIAFLMKSLNLFKFIGYIFTKGNAFVTGKRNQAKAFMVDNSKRKLWNTLKSNVSSKKKRFDEIN